ncbi:hypothetical protein EDB19DRAFT_1635993, partial [Suillus lakei]
DSDHEICQLVDFSLSTLNCTLQQKCATGDVKKKIAIRHGCPHKLTHSDSLYLLWLAHHKPTLFFDEYSCHLKEYCDLPVSLATIHASFKCAGLNIKWVQKLASKRCGKQLRSRRI